jgi:hypothetical protein
VRIEKVECVASDAAGAARDDLVDELHVRGDSVRGRGWQEVGRLAAGPRRAGPVSPVERPADSIAHAFEGIDALVARTVLQDNAAAPYGVN